MTKPIVAQKHGSDGMPHHGAIALPPDFLGDLEDPLKGLLMDKGTSDLITQIDARVAELLCHAATLVETVRRENESNTSFGGGLLTLSFQQGNSRWRCRGALVKRIAVETERVVNLDRYVRFNVFDSTWEHYGLVDAILRSTSPPLHRFYRAMDFAVTEVEARIACYQSTRNTLLRLEETLSRKSRMTIKERDLVHSVLTGEKTCRE